MESEKWDLGLQAFYAQKELQGISSDQEALIGYDEEKKEWELVIKYQGNLADALKEVPQVRLEELIAGYGILTVPEELLEQVSELPQIEYLEKPKQYFAQELRPRTVQQDCLLNVKNREPFLSGEGVIMAILDSGITRELPEFQNSDGSSRIIKYLDLTKQQGYENQAPYPEDGAAWIDVSGHGTAVASIAAGSNLGIANRAEILVVKLGGNAKTGFGKTTDIMRGVTYALKYAIEEKKPLVINLSFGSVFGAHRGNSLLERFLDNASEIWKTVICVGAGNEGDANGHVGKRFISDRTEEIEFSIGSFERKLVLEMFLGIADVYTISLVTPFQEEYVLKQEGAFLASQRTYSLFSYGMSGTPYQGQREMYLELTADVNLPVGLWKIRIKSGRVVDGRIDIYMTGTEGRGSQTGFLQPDPNGTITIPATAEKVISVGATDSSGRVYAPFSGRGFTETSFGYFRNKPELVAAGVDIPAISRNGEVITVTGTSFSTPIVSGMAALMMEWGIVKGNDPYLYGQKCKSKLIQGATRVSGVGTMQYPNPLVGWGSACDIL